MARGDRPLHLSPGIILGKRYSVYEPVEGSYPRPVLKGKTYAVGQLDTPHAFGSRVWSYLMERYTISKALKKDIKAEEGLGESVHRGIEDLRILSLVLTGKTALPDFAVGSIETAYRSNRTLGYMRNPSNIPMLSLLYLAHYGLEDTESAAPALPPGIQEKLDVIGNIVRENCEDPQITKIAAQMFIDLFTKADGQKKPMYGRGNPWDHEDLEYYFKPGNVANPFLTAPTESKELTQSFGALKFFSQFDAENERIERMIREDQMLMQIRGASSTIFRIVELPMPIIHFRDKTRGYAASDFGVVPRYVSRYPWGPMFTMRAKGVGGGTVLIDNSGSMGYRADQIAEIVHKVPAATIASYNGYGRSGTLFILARAGRMATPEAIGRAHVGSGNIVDLQSLMWLRLQKGPRIWISDNGVTGEHDWSFEEITTACDEIRRKAKIIRCLDGVTEIIRLLKGGKK